MLHTTQIIKDDVPLGTKGTLCGPRAILVEHIVTAVWTLQSSRSLLWRELTKQPTLPFHSIPLSLCDLVHRNTIVEWNGMEVLPTLIEWGAVCCLVTIPSKMGWMENSALIVNTEYPLIGRTKNSFDRYCGLTHKGYSVLTINAEFSMCCRKVLLGIP